MFIDEFPALIKGLLQDSFLGFKYLQGVEVIGHDAGQVHMRGSGYEVARIEHFIIDEHAHVAAGMTGSSQDFDAVRNGERRVHQEQVPFEQIQVGLAVAPLAQGALAPGILPFQARYDHLRGDIHILDAAAVVEVEVGADETVHRVPDEPDPVEGGAEYCPVFVRVERSEAGIHKICPRSFADAQHIGGHEDAVFLVGREPLLPHGPGHPAEHGPPVQKEVAAVDHRNSRAS